MRYFVRESIKGVRRTDSNQFYKSSIFDNSLNSISKELDVQANKSEIIAEHFEYTKNFKKVFETEFDSQCEDYRNIK